MQSELNEQEKARLQELRNLGVRTAEQDQEMNRLAERETGAGQVSEDAAQTQAEDEDSEEEGTQRSEA